MNEWMNKWCIHRKRKTEDSKKKKKLNYKPRDIEVQNNQETDKDAREDTLTQAFTNFPKN